MHERRIHERRTNPAVPEPLQRRTSRREGERRDSVRFSVAFELVPEGETVAGELGLGGASYWSTARPTDDLRGVRTMLGRVRYWLPMRVLGVTPEREGFRVRLGFMELPVQAELAIARWLDRCAARPTAVRSTRPHRGDGSARARRPQGATAASR